MRSKIFWSNKGVKGATLIEVLIASSILLVVIGMAYAGWWAMSRHFDFVSSHVEARQEARKVSNTIADDIRNASYVYIDQDNITLGGNTFNLADIDEEGQAVVFAVPENSNVGSVTYTIIGYYLGKPYGDQLNPVACDLMRYEVHNITPPIADTPSSINISGLTGGSTKKVASYIDSQRFVTIVKNNGRSVEVRPLATKRVRTNQKTAEAQVILCVNIRNQ